MSGGLELRRCVHFVWFRGDEYWSAIRVWGPPEYVHIGWDKRAWRDVHPDDIVIFARGAADQQPRERTFNDINEAAARP